MTAELGFVLEEDGNVLAVELVEPRIGIDVDLLELDAEAAQSRRHLFAEMAVGASV
jgi:hypothetical protein